MPAEMPRPPGLRVLKAQGSGEIYRVSFQATQSIKEASQFLALQLPAAGFSLHGGDSEAGEIDQPFAGHGKRGSFKIQSTSTPCTLQGVLVILPPA